MIAIKDITKRIKKIFCGHKNEELVCTVSTPWGYPTAYFRCECCGRVRRSV